MNSGRMNNLEELGRIDSEKMNPNRRAEKRRVVGEIKRGYKAGGKVKGYEHGGKVRGCGIAKKGFNKSIMKS
mgnify:FL=1|jgi:hypothetical protein|tara:strand:- start:476 stop:691 length:216 start_codon:yes stop_codon:yes gene_type:complete